MFRKLLLIALVCVSFAQVHGGLVENTINRGLLKIRGMNDNVQERLREANRDTDDKKQLIFFKTAQFISKISKAQESSRQSLRNVAAAMERKAEENRSPQSVFECIRRNENQGNGVIEHNNYRFGENILRLKRTNLNNINTAVEIYFGLSENLEVRYLRASSEMVECQNVRCVYNIIEDYSSFLNTIYATFKRVERQTSTILANFQRDANTYFTSTNRQISRTRSAAIRDIRNCYFRGDRELLGSEDAQETQETQEA